MNYSTLVEYFNLLHKYVHVDPVHNRCKKPKPEATTKKLPMGTNKTYTRMQYKYKHVET